jgi:group I intron endonuclease
VKVSAVYQIRNVANGNRYVGSSSDVRARWRAHRRCLNLGKHHAPHLQAAWTKYGPDAFVFEYLETCSPDALFAVEQRYLDANRGSLYNCQPNAGGGRGYRLPEEQKRKIGLANTGRRWTEEEKRMLGEARRGILHSDETKRRMSETRKGRPKSVAHRKAIGDWHRGRPKSAETREKMAEAQKRRWQRWREARQ